MPKLTRYAILLSLGITGFSVLVSVSITLLWFGVDSDVSRSDVLFVATLIPLICGPVCTLYGVRGRQRIQELASENERLANTDMLTGLANRRAFFTQIAKPDPRAGASTGKVAYILCDIDSFKTFNDRHGHEAGDEALKHVANVLKSALPENAYLARLGGEEFVVYVSKAHQLDVDALAARLISTVADTPLAYDGKEFNVTMSVGLHVTTTDADPDHALRNADRAMYAAKANGRNQFVRAA